MLKEYQLDPVTHHLLHADFYRVAMDKVITVTVPIVLRGEAPGVKQQGGLLDFVHREIEVECLPADIPEHIEMDVSKLMLNQSIRLRDITESMKWTPVSDPDLMLVHVVTPKVEAEPEAAEAEAAATPAEPEVIKKGKAEKEEGRGREQGRSSRRSRQTAARATLSAREADRRPRQPGAEVPRHPAQRRLRGGRRAGAARHGGAFEAAPAEALMARAADARATAARCWLKPLTLMNLSGVAVSEVARYFRIDAADILVVADDVNLPLGRLRARPRGSDGGHNGLPVDHRAARDTPEFARLRVGVGRGDPRRDLADHVLGGFDADERPRSIEAAIGRAADASELFVADGIEAVMNRFNGRGRRRRRRLSAGAGAGT